MCRVRLKKHETQSRNWELMFSNQFLSMSSSYRSLYKSTNKESIYAFFMIFFFLFLLTLHVYHLSKIYYFLFLLPLYPEAFKTCKNTIELLNLCVLPCLGSGNRWQAVKLTLCTNTLQFWQDYWSQFWNSSILF